MKTYTVVVEDTSLSEDITVKANTVKQAVKKFAKIGWEVNPSIIKEEKYE